MNSLVHAATAPLNPNINIDLELGNPDDTIDYKLWAQWLRASVVAADGAVLIASLMIGVSAASMTAKAMLVSGLACLVAGACSKATGEFVSVYAQYVIEKTMIKKTNRNDGDENNEPLANPCVAAGVSALAFSIGGLLPLLAAAFIKSWGLRLGVVCTVSALGLAVFGAIGVLFGGTKPNMAGALRVLIRWLAVLMTYGILKFFYMKFSFK